MQKPIRKIKPQPTMAQPWRRCRARNYHFRAFEAMTPLFEQMVIASIKKVQSQIHEPSLKSDIKWFLAQEARHAMAYARYNGWEQGKITLKPTKLGLFRWVINHTSSSFQLAASAFGEHMTAVTGEWMLKDKSWLRGASKTHKTLWRYHSVEEIEHKHVAFDVYATFHCNYPVRLGAAFLFMGLFLIQYHLLIHRFCREDNVSFFKTMLQMLKIQWTGPKYFSKMIRPLLSYAIPFYHPDKRDNRDLASYWSFKLEKTERLY